MIGIWLQRKLNVRLRARCGAAAGEMTVCYGEGFLMRAVA